MENIDRTSKNNYIKLFIILYFLAFLFLCLLEPCCVKRKIFPYGIVMVPYYIIVLTSAFILTDVLQNNFCNLKKEKEKSPNKFKIKKIVIIIFFLSILFIKSILTIKAKQNINYIISFKELAAKTILYSLSGIGEEILFNGLLYEFLKSKKIPFVISLFIVSILFSFVHLQFSYHFFILIFFRVFILIGYYFYPSLFFFGLFHTLWNLSLLLLMAL